MPRFITPPDLEFDKDIIKILIRNCTWTNEQISDILLVLGDKNYDIYLYNDSMGDIQWFEGIRAMAKAVLDCNHYQGQDPKVWLKQIDDKMKIS